MTLLEYGNNGLFSTNAPPIPTVINAKTGKTLQITGNNRRTVDVGEIAGDENMMASEVFVSAYLRLIYLMCIYVCFYL